MDSINISDNLKIRKTDEPVVVQQTGYISCKKSDFERVPNKDTVTFKGNDDNSDNKKKGWIIGLSTLLLLTAAVVGRAGYHGAKIFEEAGIKEGKGAADKVKMGFKNFFTGKEKAAEKLTNVADTKKPPVSTNPKPEMPKAEDTEKITNEIKEYSIDDFKANCRTENGVIKLNNGELFTGKIRRVNGKGEEIISEFKDGKITKLTKDFTQDKTSINKMVTEYGENGEKQIKYLNKEGKEVNFFEELAKNDGEHILRNGTRLIIKDGQVSSVCDKSGHRVYETSLAKDAEFVETISDIEKHVGVRSKIEFGTFSSKIYRIEEYNLSLQDHAYTNKTIAELRQELLDKYIKDSSTKKAILERLPKNITRQEVIMNDVAILTGQDGTLCIRSRSNDKIPGSSAIYHKQANGNEFFRFECERGSYYHNIENGEDIFIGPAGKITKEEFIRQRNHSIATALTDEQMATLNIRTPNGELATRANSLPTNVEGNYIIRTGVSPYDCDYVLLSPEGKIVGKIQKYTPDGHFEFLEIYNEQGEKIRRMARLDKTEYRDTLYDHGNKKNRLDLQFGDSSITETLKALINDTKGILH